MEQLKHWAKDNRLYGSAPLFAISHDNPETTPPGNCRFDACIVISAEYQLDDGVLEGELIGGNYLVYKVRHTAEDTLRAYSEIFPSLLQNGFEMDNKPIIERYTGEAINNPYCEICVPIK